MTLRVRALETILTEKGYVDPAALDLIVETYETKIGPRNGARVVARAWSEPGVQARAPRRMRPRRSPTLGYAGRVGDHLVAVENTPKLHNMVVCTLCSCYPWTCSACRRSGTNRRPTARARSGTRAACSPISASKLPAETEIRVWDSTAETRFLVVPMRPAGTEGWDEERLAALVTRDCDDRHRPRRSAPEEAGP